MLNTGNFKHFQLIASKAADESMNGKFVLPSESLNTLMRGKERKGLEI